MYAARCGLAAATNAARAEAYESHDDVLSQKARCEAAPETHCNQGRTQITIHI